MLVHTHARSYACVCACFAQVFKKARLPFQLTEHSYTILDTSEGSVFLHVNHGDYNTGCARPIRTHTHAHTHIDT